MTLGEEGTEPGTRQSFGFSVRPTTTTTTLVWFAWRAPTHVGRVTQTSYPRTCTTHCPLLERIHHQRDCSFLVQAVRYMVSSEDVGNQSTNGCRLPKLT